MDAADFEDNKIYLAWYCVVDFKVGVAFIQKAFSIWQTLLEWSDRSNNSQDQKMRVGIKPLKEEYECMGCCQTLLFSASATAQSSQFVAYV